MWERNDAVWRERKGEREEMTLNEWMKGGKK